MRALVTVFVLSACGGLDPAPRANLPKRLAPVPVDTVYSTYVKIHHGSRAPIPVEDLRARCADATVCSVAIDAGQRWPELQIIGHRPGRTTVIAEYIHPTHKRPIVEEIAIELTPPPRYATLAFGAPPPAGDVVMHHLRASELSLTRPAGDDPLIPMGRCAPGSSDAYRIDGAARDDVRVFECTLGIEIAAAQRFRRCAGACPTRIDERYTVCAQVTGDRIAAARILQPKYERTHLALEEKHTLGAFTSHDVCAVKPNT